MRKDADAFVPQLAPRCSPGATISSARRAIDVFRRISRPGDERADATNDAQGWRRALSERAAMFPRVAAHQARHWSSSSRPMPTASQRTGTQGRRILQGAGAAAIADPEGITVSPHAL